MATIKELLEKRAKLVANARAKFDEIKTDTEEARAAEIEAEFDVMMGEASKLGDTIKRQESLEGLESALELRGNRAPLHSLESESSLTPAEGPTYREAFHAYLANQGQLGNMHAEERQVLAAGFAKLTKEQRAQTTTNAAGGYTVPEELQKEIIKSLKAWGPMFDEDICRVFNTANGNPIPIPTVDDTAKTAEASGGEAVTLTDDGGKDVVFGRKVLGAYSFDTEWLRVGAELDADSIFAIEALLGDLLGERLGRKANNALTVGSGSSAPLGIVTGSSLGKTAAGAAALTADELIALFHSVNAAYRRSPRSRMMFNDNTLLALHKLKDGQGNYLIEEADDTSGVLKLGAIKARYSINDDMADIGATNKSVIYGDFGKYFVRKVGQTMVGALTDKDFWPGFGVAGFMRLDGLVGDAAAIKHLIHPA